MLNSRLLELALLWLEIQIIRLHTSQDLVDDLSMFDDVATENEDVVEVHGDLAFHDEVLEDVIHERGERAGRVRQTKEYDGWLEESSVGCERSLPLVTSLDADVVVAPSDVQHGVDLRILQVIHELRNQWQWVPVLDRDLIQTTVVLDRS